MLLKRVLLGFWALFFTLVFLTDLTDGLKAMGVLPAGFAFASGNYPFMLDVTSIYHTPEWLVIVFFLGVIAWTGAATVLFWRSTLSYGRATSDRTVQTAFAVGTALWAAFLVADEFYLTYLNTDLTGTHLRLFIAQLVSYLVIILVPAGGAGAEVRK